MSTFNSTLSNDVVIFKNSPVSFEINVNNLSNNYASFKVNLYAPGKDPNRKNNWYNLDPLTSTLIPPGDNTKFKVTILESPILEMDLINIKVKVSSVELPDINFHNLKLKITTSVAKLKLYLPVNSFAIYPRKILDIPVHIINSNHYSVDVVLRLTGLDGQWLERGKERKLRINPDVKEETKFTCQPPIVKYTPCGTYPFTIAAYTQEELELARIRGRIEILPFGEISFSVEPQIQSIPTKPSFLPQFKTEPAIYQLKLENLSNIVQDRITISVDKNLNKHSIEPSHVKIKLGETGYFNFKSKIKRPWLGLKYQYSFKLTPSLQDTRLKNTNPSSQNIKLKVYPLLPIWLQLGLGTILTTTLLFLLSIFLTKKHTNEIASLSFNTDINSPTIISSSKDGTVRKWQATNNNIFCQWFKYNLFCLKHQKVLIDNRSPSDSAKDWANIVKFRTDNNLSGRDIFFGFENGKVSSLDINTNQEKPLIKDAQKLETDLHKEGTNRILDITFTSDKKNIFIARGVTLLKWNLQNNTPDEDLARKLQKENGNKTIYYLLVAPDLKNIVASTLDNQIFLVSIDDPNKYTIINNCDYTNTQQITGLAITDNKDNNLLLSSNSKGSIKIWNLNQIETNNCPYEENITSLNNNQNLKINNISLTKKEQEYYLAASVSSNNNQHQVMIFSLKANPTQPKLTLEKVIDYSEEITAIDTMFYNSNSYNQLLILTGSENGRVDLKIYQPKQ